MIIIGIDPGLTGALAVLDSEKERELYDMDGQAGYRETGNVITVPKVFDTPTALVVGEKTKHKYLAPAMALLLKPYAGRQDVLAVLENVHSMPKQGVASSFGFGEGKGLWEGILAAYEIPTELVSPQRWKKAILVDMGQEKSASRFKAMALFPQLAEQLKLVKHDGRAEALLMAEYGRRLRKEV